MSNLLKETDFVWKELYPNNMPCNGTDGYYCLVDVGGGTARMYTLKYQREKRKKDGSNEIKEKRNGYTYISTPIQYWILLERIITDIKGEVKIPEPCNNFSLDTEDGKLSACSVNNHGSFVRVYTDLEEAKKGAYGQYIEIQGFVMAHMEQDIDDAKERMEAYNEFMKDNE